MAWWRPSKIEKWIVWFEEVLKDSDNALLCTDEELVMLVNETLPEEEKIHENTFINWKAWEISDEYKEFYAEFLCLYKNALLKEKKSLMKKFKEDQWQWQKWAWIIERKFDEWNIRIKTDNKNDNKESWELTIKWQK